MNIRILLCIHAFITLAAGTVLVVAPTVIPHTVNMPLEKSQYLLCYFLAAGEWMLAYLSFASSRLHQVDALRLVVRSLIVFHAATALLEGYAFLRAETGALIFGNIALRVVIVALLGYYGLSKKAS